MAKLSTAQMTRLAQLTHRLVNSRDGASEVDRFRHIRSRVFAMPERDDSGPARTIVVTGGTGCIGSALLQRLVRRPQDRIVSISRGLTVPPRSLSGVEYRTLDIQCAAAVNREFADIRPDFVYHLAAVRDPAQAEIEVERTIGTNVVATGHLLEAAKSVGVTRFIYASTGKSVRFYTSDVYAATKKIGERLVANSGLPVCSSVRYTHVVNNSLIMRKLTEPPHGLIRLHGPEIGFHVQSALESVQLLLVASWRSGLYSMRDLGWPIALLDLAVDLMRATGTVTPIYFSGYEPGYDSESYPGLYDPAVSGHTGPLVNSIEARSTIPALGDQLNHVPLAGDGDALGELVLAELGDATVRRPSPGLLRSRLNTVSKAYLGAFLARASRDEVSRVAQLGRTYTPANLDHEITYRAMISRLGSIGSGAPPSGPRQPAMI